MLVELQEAGLIVTMLARCFALAFADGVSEELFFCFGLPPYFRLVQHNI